MNTTRYLKACKKIQFINHYSRNCSSKSSNSPLLETFLKKNAAWAKEKRIASPELLESFKTGQDPKILWIGCADSRIPETTVLNGDLGDFFVHRNIANQCRSDDKSLDSILEFATETLDLKHIVVCGHYGCSGVKAALLGCELKQTNEWLKPISELAQSKSEEEAWRTLVHLNVKNSVDIVKGHSSVVKALKAEKLSVHGWVYDVSTGIITDA